MTQASGSDADLQGLRFDSRVALVTGAARGLGLAIAETLGDRGARVLLVDVDGPSAERAAAMLRGKGTACQARAADVSVRADCDASVGEAVNRWGRLDILVNNAGIGGNQLPAWEIDDDDWHRVLSVNLDGTFYMCKAAVPVMMKQGYGRIVNMASIAGKDGNAKNSQYSVSKAGVICLTKCLGKELATTGVLVNAIAPAIIDTDIIRQPGIDPSVFETLAAKIPMGRLGRPHEVARLAGFLASEHVSFSTGAVYDISGGRATY